MFRPRIVAIFREVFFEGYQRTSKPIYRYKILSFKYDFLKYLALNIRFKIYVKIYNTDNINCAKLLE